MNINAITLIFRKVINYLFIDDPKATSMGVLLGVAADSIISIAQPFLKTIESIAISSVTTWHLLASGVLITNLPSFLRRKSVDPSITKALDYIKEQQKEGVIPEWRARQMYDQLFTEILERVTVEDKNSEQLLNANSGQDDQESK